VQEIDEKRCKGSRSKDKQPTGNYKGSVVELCQPEGKEIQNVFTIIKIMIVSYVIIIVNDFEGGYYFDPPGA
jgi:hypothetical protein